MIAVGLDPSNGPQRPTAAVRLDGTALSLARQPLFTDGHIIGWCLAQRPDVVSIDAPLALPAGLHCLDPAHPCPDPGTARSAETALRARGIPCYMTNKRSWIRGLIERSIAISQALREAGVPVIEAFPFAIKHELWLADLPATRWRQVLPRKTSPAGRAALRARVMELGLGPSWLIATMSHDALDAALAAWMGARFLEGRYTLVGAAHDGPIVLPQKDTVR